MDTLVSAWCDGENCGMAVRRPERQSCSAPDLLSVLGWATFCDGAAIFSSLDKKLFCSQVNVVWGLSPHHLASSSSLWNSIFLIHKSKGENTTPLSWCEE